MTLTSILPIQPLVVRALSHVPGVFCGDNSHGGSVHQTPFSDAGFREHGSFPIEEKNFKYCHHILENKCLK